MLIVHKGKNRTEGWNSGVCILEGKMRGKRNFLANNVI